MTIYEYITKNLPNLNWNILPQIFENNGVELTEDIEKYLRETPGNTNWNVFNSISENTGGKIKIFEGTMKYTETQGPYRPLAQSYQTLTNTFDTNCNSLIVYFENEEYELVKQDGTYKSTNGLNFSITDSGVISGVIYQSSFPVTIQRGQLYNVEIYAII